MQTRDQVDTPLQDYPDRSVWTTWTISFNVIREQDKAASNLLLLWSFLDNKDLWFGLFTAVCSASQKAAAEVSRWIGDLANSRLKFTQSMQLLRSYSLVESVENGAGYATHPVVHRWARYYCGQDYNDELSRLALVVVGWGVPHNSTRDYSVLQRRLLPHAQACSQRMVEKHGYRNGSGLERSRTEGRDVILDAIHLLGSLYADQGKLGEAEKMYMRALQGYEEALGPKHTSTLSTVNNLGLLYAKQDKLGEAEKMYMRALQGREEALGPKHTSTLDSVHCLANLYAGQGKLGEAEKMYVRALQGYEEALGPKHTSTLLTVNSLGSLYFNQGKLGEAEKMFMQALQGYEEALGPKHTSTLMTVNNLGAIYTDQGKLDEAEKMYMRALQGYEEALGMENIDRYIPALNTMWGLGNLFQAQKELVQAKQMFQRALTGFQVVIGASCAQSQQLGRALASLDAPKSKSRTLIGRIKRRIFSS